MKVPTYKFQFPSVHSTGVSAQEYPKQQERQKMKIQARPSAEDLITVCRDFSFHLSSIMCDCFGDECLCKTRYIDVQAVSKMTAIELLSNFLTSVYELNTSLWYLCLLMTNSQGI